MKKIVAAILMFGVSFFSWQTTIAQSCSAQCAAHVPEDMPRCLDDCKSNQQGSLEVMPRLTGETQVAVNDCSVECRFEHEDNYGTCLANCQANQQGSVDGTQTAAFCVWTPRGYMCIPQSSSNSVEGTGQSLTRFASSVRLGDPQPMCGTDAWACFNGTDDESPAIRDVGIFGIFASNHPCMHPSCD